MSRQTTAQRKTKRERAAAKERIDEILSTSSNGVTKSPKRRKQQRQEPKLWQVWGLRRGWHPLEEGAWHPLFQYRSEARAQLAAEQAPSVAAEERRNGPAKYGAGVAGYKRFKACPPGKPPVNPAKVRPARRRKACRKCMESSLVKKWLEEGGCPRCGWAPKRRKARRKRNTTS